MFSFPIPLLGRPILWYGFLFACGFLVGYLLLVYLLKRYFPKAVEKEKVYPVADKLLVYVVIGTLVGARLFDVLFYQSFSSLMQDPLSALYFWEGGLASHGGAAGILLALWLFSKRYKRLRFLNLLDLLVIPACFAGVFIRVGNFINQEILGKPTELPWAVIFLHPADGSFPVPRHPVQLYEACFYFLLGWGLWLYRRKLSSPGKLGGLFLLICFSFRFLIEGLKEEQSVYFSSNSYFSMGQLLSIPFVLLGIFLVFNKNSIRVR